jgi:hypothetical protein
MYFVGPAQFKKVRGKGGYSKHGRAQQGCSFRGFPQVPNLRVIYRITVAKEQSIALLKKVAKCQTAEQFYFPIHFHF